MNSRQADVLWIEADPLSGGSGNQVEIPRDGALFFGGSDDPASEELQITIQHAGHEFKQRLMNFRPSSGTNLNQMWRLNLPTARQGLGGYEGKVLVFERTNRASDFLLHIVDKESNAYQNLLANTRSQDRIDTRRTDDTVRTGGYYAM